MKHPALTRVMAIALVIMCVIMAAAGAAGIGKAEKQLNSDKADYEKLTGRIETYEQLSKELEGKESYKQANEKLAERQEQHDKDASQYRTDLAERTATQGGYKKGADALWEAQAQLKEGELQYNAGLAQFKESEAEFNSMKAQTQQMIETAQTLAGMCSAAASAQTPVQPEQPAAVEDPGEFTPAEGLSDEELAAARAEYDAKLQAYNDYLEAEKAYEQALREYPAKMLEYQTAIAKGQAALAGGNKLLESAGMGGGITDYNVMAATLTAAAESAQKQLDEGQAAIDAAKQKLEAAGTQIESGKQKIDGNLEQIWYKMGQFEDEEAEYSENREKLLNESEELAAEKEKLDEQKNDENKLNSTRLILKGYDGIKAKLDSGGVLPDSAQEYALEFYGEYNRLHTGRIVISILEIVGGILGFVCLPAAFEKNKSRLMLLLPAAASLACAAAAETAGVCLGLGQSYAAIPVILFAVLYLCSAAPKKA